jgi:MPBQ/MSBQ methyltransferase
MSGDADRIQRHYARPALLEVVRGAVAEGGGDPDHPTLDELAPLDEFHLGARAATEEMIGRLGDRIGAHSVVLDVGCGIGGPARLLADRTGCRVEGVDLTAEFVRTGTALNDLTGLGDRVSLREADATALPFGDGALDAAWMLHVGMNIPDKAGVLREVHRVLRPGAVFLVYDVMGEGNDVLDFPLPWADDPSYSAVAPAGEYVRLLEEAGFRILHVEPRADIARAFFAGQRRAREDGTRPPMRGDLLLSDAPTRFGNLAAAVQAGRVAPTEILAERG